MPWYRHITRATENLLTSGMKDTTEAGLLWRVRVLNLTGMLLVFFAVMWAFAFVSYRVWEMIWVILALAVTEVIILVYFRRTHRLASTSHLTVGLLLVGISIPTWYTGGLTGVNVTPFFLVPLIAITLLGKWGLLWGLISLAWVGVIQYLTFTGYPFPQVIPEESLDTDMLLTWLTTFVVLVALASHYEGSRNRAERRIAEEKQRAEEASRAKGQFLANMSHELRTPMNAIIGLTDLTLKTDLDDSQRRNLQRVKDDAYSLLSMLEDVLDASRLEAGKLELHLEPFSPRALVDEVIRAMQLRAESKGLLLEYQLDESVPANLKGDAARIKQILVNLVDNAIKFTDSGSVDVNLEYREEDGLRLSVRDTGIGIPQAHLPAIFESFSQVDGSVSRRHRGTGLGLSICKQLAEFLGGRIVVESQEGQGSEFRVLLPFPRAEASEARAARGRILAAEDDEISRELVETILRSAGYQVDTMVDGRAAVEAAGRGGYSLVLMDVQMPGMDGLEAARRIRAGEDPNRRVPIVAITAHALSDERDRCLQAGMDDFVTKPIEPSSLVATVRRWIG